MQLPEHFRILAESQNYILGHVAEYGYIFDKKFNSNTYLGASYGDPTFGIIDKNEQWAMLLGHTSYLWTPSEVINLNEGYALLGEIFEYPFDARQISDFEVDIIEDPWSDNPGIYALNVKSKSIKRIRDFKKLEIPYDDNLKVNW
jgi:hypothetical protein